MSIDNDKDTEDAVNLSEADEIPLESMIVAESLKYRKDKSIVVGSQPTKDTKKKVIVGPAKTGVRSSLQKQRKCLRKGRKYPPQILSMMSKRML